MCPGVYEFTSGWHVRMRNHDNGSEYVDDCPQCRAVVRVDWVADNGDDVQGWQIMPHDPKGA